MRLPFVLSCCVWLFLSSGLMAQESIPAEVQAKIEYLAASKDENGWGRLYYDVLSKVVRAHKYKSVAEIGVALGGHAEYILKHTAIDQYFGVDPYLCFDPNDGFQHEIAAFSPHEVQQNFDYLYAWVKNVRLAPYGERGQLIREPSVAAASHFNDESLDCIFIDGDHRYEAVMQDLQAWFPKLKPGHLILGDDYWIGSVAAAVDQFFFDQGREVFFFTSDAGYRIWAAYK